MQIIIRIPFHINGNKILTIKARTVRGWLDKLEFSYKNTMKNIYLNSHERQNVIEY